MKRFEARIYIGRIADACYRWTRIMTEEHCGYTDTDGSAEIWHIEAESKRLAEAKVADLTRGWDVDVISIEEMR